MPFKSEKQRRFLHANHPEVAKDWEEKYEDNEEDYENVSGFCYDANFEEIEKNSFVLTPGRYVGAAKEEDDGEPFDEKMKRLTSLLKEQQEEGVKLDQQIAANLRRFTFEK